MVVQIIILYINNKKWLGDLTSFVNDSTRIMKLMRITLHEYGLYF